MKQIYYKANNAALIEQIYPVGSIYINTGNVNPTLLFGGEWAKLENRFLLCSGSSYQTGQTGGETSHALTTDEMPKHTHSILAHSHGLASHTHTYTDTSSTTSGAGTGTTGSTTISFSNGSAYLGKGTATDANITALKEKTVASWTYGLKVTDYTDTGNSNTSKEVTYLTESQAHTHGMASHTHGANNTYSTRTSGKAAGSTDNSTAFNTGSKGSGEAMNNMPPYLVVGVWKRTA